MEGKSKNTDVTLKSALICFTAAAAIGASVAYNYREMLRNEIPPVVVRTDRTLRVLGNVHAQRTHYCGRLLQEDKELGFYELLKLTPRKKEEVENTKKRVDGFLLNNPTVCNTPKHDGVDIFSFMRKVDGI